MRTLYRSRLWSFKLVGLGIVLLALLALGCVDTASGVKPTPGNSYSPTFDLTEGPLYSGLMTMEELIAYAEAVARVEYRSARQTVEEIQLDYGPDNNPRYTTLYANSLEITFEVLEYLMGSGGSEIKVVLDDRDGWRYTRAEVETLDENLIPLRNTGWDSREAIVFLHSGDLVVSTFEDPDRYWLASLRNNGEDGYTVASKWMKAWLPDAAAPDSEDDVSETEQRFLINLSSTSGAGVQGDTMTLSELKTLVTRIQNELTAGGTEEHAKCIRHKYSEARYEQWYKTVVEDDWGRDYNLQHEKEIGSGAPAGTVVYVDAAVSHLDAEDLPAPTDIDDVILHMGQDAALFDKTWPLTSVTGRPLPEGTYRFYWAGQPSFYTLCDALPELRRTSNEIIVTVTAPEGTLREAFFDPVTLASGVGADSSNGVLNPASFTVDGTSTSITGLKWESGSVVLSLSPFSSLSGHKLDFIGLDGSVSLSLPASSATEDATAGTLTWSVSDQPWHDGDTLMLRISPSTTVPTPVPTPEPTPEPTPVSTPGITVTLSPRPLIPTDYINLSIRWVDPASCDSRYFVGIYNSSGTTIYRFYGYHPAPDTTSLERELGLLWDRIADLDWLVRVSCVPASGDESLVGEAELRSGLPETP